MTVYNVEINKIFKVLNDLSVHSKYINITLDDKTNTVKIISVPPIETYPKQLNTNNLLVNKNNNLSELI
jgi:hypothetical protein